jgi:hypothetical protein
MDDFAEAVVCVVLATSLALAVVARRPFCLESHRCSLLVVAAVLVFLSVEQDRLQGTVEMRATQGLPEPQSMTRPAAGAEL